MIKINLLKEENAPKRTHGLPKSFAVIPLAFVAIAATISLVIILGNRSKEPPVAKAELPHQMDTPVVTARSADSTPDSIKTVAEPAAATSEEKITQSEKEPVPQVEEIKTAAKVPVDTPKSDYAPSTHTSNNVVEDIVSDRSRKTAAELLALSYKEMSPGEKIIYEMAFTKKIFELLTYAVPEGIEFSSLAIDSFTVIKATGLGSSRDLVGNLFHSLRNEKNLHLRERPASSIRPLTGKGYRFDFSCDASFGVDTSEAYRAMSNLAPHESFSGMLKTFKKLVLNNGIVLENELERTGTEKTAGCRRYTYHLSGSSTYPGFVKLVLDLQKKRLPCSFNRIKLKARNNAKIAIDADVVFTLQN